ncbi:MAG: hypothetical protein A2297_08350 [Elusimicrobia bacterium RIFOXYB2_FULL_48_7]|nr:MAG: hypothetical protein A2297_08350 [Elusimicrobia bacterium RIFOXYB2_FULL_48_7]
MAKNKVIVIDDDETYLEEFRSMLVSNGYSVETTSDCMGAVNAIIRSRPDVIILDLKMKEKNGFQIAAELSLIPETSDIPIIAITGYFKEREHVGFMKINGIKDYLIKPINPKDIITKIEWHIKNRDISSQSHLQPFRLLF